jgi:hypothetical protein
VEKVNRSEATKILAVLAAAYPSASIKNASPDEAEGIVTVWAIQFANIPADIVFMAVNKHISTGKFFPSICEIKNKLSDLHWDAYTAISSHGSKYLSIEARSECERIYEATKNYKMGICEPELNDMLINNSKQFLIE